MFAILPRWASFHSLWFQFLVALGGVAAQEQATLNPWWLFGTILGSIQSIGTSTLNMAYVHVG